MDKEKGKEERQEEKVGKAKARARREQALLRMMKAMAKGPSQRLKVSKVSQEGSQDNNTSLVDLSEDLVDLEDDPTAEETVVASAVELDVEPMEEPLEVASAADEVMEETEAPSALGPGADEEMMEPSAVEAMEAELEAAFDAADAEMVDHSNGNNNEGIDDSLMLSELLGQHVNQDSLKSSSLSPSPSTPSPPRSDIENSSPQTHGPAVEEPGQEVAAEEAGEALVVVVMVMVMVIGGGGGGGGGGPRLHWTPHVFVALEPHGQFKIRLNYNEHRFIGETIRVDSDAFIGVQRQKTYSRKFGGGRTWKEALHEVHKWLWEKWQIVESEFALARTVRQVPGEVPAGVLAELEPIIRDMPPEKNYCKSK